MAIATHAFLLIHAIQSKQDILYLYREILRLLVIAFASSLFFFFVSFAVIHDLFERRKKKKEHKKNHSIRSIKRCEPNREWEFVVNDLPVCIGVEGDSQ